MAKHGPKKGNAASKASGRKGGKSKPSLKKGRHKVGARHAKPATKR